MSDTDDIMEQGPTIEQLCRDSYKIAKEKGWWDDDPLRDPNVLAAKIALIHSEASEALECVREGDFELRFRETDEKPESLMIELADIVIRVADLSQALLDQDVVSITLAEAVIVKENFNRMRERKHGGKAI